MVSAASQSHDVGYDALIRHLLDGSELPVLIMTAAHLSGKLSLLREEWRPTNVFGKLRCQVEASIQDEIRKACADELWLFLASGHSAPPLTFDLIHDIATWAAGRAIEPLVPLLLEELALDGQDRRKPRWQKQEIASERPFHVAIIGGGESGIVAAIRLRQAGVPFTIYEKNEDLGGTWLENDYPGCRVDINSFVYSYAFEQRIWTEYFGQQPEVREYFQSVARKHGLYEHVRLNSEVLETTWDETAVQWRVKVRSGDLVETLAHEVVVFAVGQLNRPKLPDIDGIEIFAGNSFHSARWDHDVDLHGKRVAVLGTGASACQFIPQVAREAAQVTVFARTTTWLLPTPELHDEVPASTRWLLENIPGYAVWFRGSMLMTQGPGLLDRVTVDPGFAHSETAVSADNDALRATFQNWLEPQIADRPDLRDAVIPTSPPGSKRILRDNGTWVSTLKRQNVEVVRTAIDHIDEAGIVTADQTRRDFDVVLYGTGFNASEFLFPIKVRGRGGTDLHALWRDDPRAYLGMTVPGFPNMFAMYGPNTNLVLHGGSIILFSELSSKYIVDAIHTLLRADFKTMEVREQPYRAYNVRLDVANASRAWGYSEVRSWYKNNAGRVTQNYPFTTAEFWTRTDHINPDDYEFT